MFRSLTRLATLALVACLALPLASPPASAASADKYTVASPLLSLKMLDAKQTKLLQRAGIRTVLALAPARPSSPAPSRSTRPGRPRSSKAPRCG